MSTSDPERRLPTEPVDPRRIVFLTWRDTTHPEGGGSEVYVERIATWLASRGHHVTIICAAHHNSPPNEIRDGVRFRRRGNQLGVYPAALAWLATAGRKADIVIDVHNGLPFLSPLVHRRRGRHVLIHHVHEAQWHIIFPGLKGRIGWWLESWFSPRLYRKTPYVTVSESTRRDLVGLGIDRDRIALVHNGIDVPHPTVMGPKSPTPRICVVSRLVPHKQVEHALHVVAKLREEIPDLRLDVVGDGWWMPRLQLAAREIGVDDAVTFHGYLDDDDRDAVVDASWVMLQPSVKEGWGISIMEAAARGVPAIAYREAGGVTESILHGETGLLADDIDEMVEETRHLLTNDDVRAEMARRARDRAESFRWDETAAAFERRLLDAS